jgi:hypothetical protein
VRPSSEVRAVCGNTASTDPRGGLLARAVPTANGVVPIVCWEHVRGGDVAIASYSFGALTRFSHNFRALIAGGTDRACAAEGTGIGCLRERCGRSLRKAHGAYSVLKHLTAACCA